MLLRVLIVDDSLAMRNKLKRYIESIGHEIVFMAKNGKEGVRVAKELRPDVITMDIAMPDISGVEAVRQIKAEGFDNEIIMVTGFGQERIVMSSLAAGAMGYLLKPINEEKIVKIFSTIWNRRKGDL